MQEIKTEARTLGVNYLNDGSVSVVVWAPNAEKVEVVMHETIALEKKEFGYWETRTCQI
jgi:maltooligosyltrehalose trehalohydrolase